MTNTYMHSTLHSIILQTNNSSHILTSLNCVHFSEEFIHKKANENKPDLSLAILD